jgi:hypothetical protein
MAMVGLIFKLLLSRLIYALAVTTRAGFGGAASEIIQSCEEFAEE